MWLGSCLRSCWLAVVVGLAVVAALMPLVPSGVEAQEDSTTKPPGPCEDGWVAPTPTNVAVTDVPIKVASTKADYFVLYVKDQPVANDAVMDIPVLVKQGESGTTLLSDNLAPLSAKRYRVEKYSVANPADLDGDCVDDIAELGNLGPRSPLSFADPINPENGAVVIKDRETFKKLAYKGPDPKWEEDKVNTEYVKFHICRFYTRFPSFQFQDTNRWWGHYGIFRSEGELNNKCRGTHRETGIVVYHPNVVAPDGSLGIYRYEFQQYREWSFKKVAYANEVLAAAMPFLANKLAYYPVGSRSKEKYAAEKSLYDASSRVNVLLHRDIAPDVPYTPYHEAEGYGLLREVEPGETPGPRDIAIMRALPNNLPRVAGVITTVPQTPLSHVNLRSIQNNIPNAFIRDALDEDDADVVDLIGSYVYYKTEASGYTLRAATKAEVDAHYSSSRPSTTQTPSRDLTVKTITALSGISFSDWDAFGVKAANMAELSKLSALGAETVPNGYGVPFYFYDEFMKANNLYAEVQKLLADDDFKTDFEEQEKELKKLRKKIKKATTPAWIITALETMHNSYPDGTSLRYRSSTNNEDLPDFSGAGLYDSKTQDPDETTEEGIDKSIKSVWASLWNFRAFAEREHHRVDHLSTAMGVLVHPNFSDELANGVAVSYDPIRGLADTYYINTQLGEDLVTNPEVNSLPEQLLLGSDGSPVVLAYSNLAESGKLFMSDAQMIQLRNGLKAIHDRFATLYGIKDGDDFAMEIEFKITAANKLAIKQARPWVFTKPLNAFGDSLPVVSITGGDDVAEGADAIFTLTAIPAPSTDLQVTVTVAAEGDYGATTGPLNVTIPTSATKELLLSTTDDSQIEADGLISVTVEASAASEYHVSSTEGAAEVTVSSEDLPVGVSAELLANVRSYATETDNGDGHVRRWKRVLLAFGEALPGFTGTPMTVTEAQGFANQFWSARWDPVVEALKKIEANLQQQQPSVPVVSITAGSDVTEGSSASFTLTANPAPTADLDVTVAVSASGSYGVTTGSRTVTIPTTGTATLNVATTGDTVDEANGSVTVTLTDGAAYDLDSSASSATVAVSDDDTPAVGVTAGSAVTEGSSASFTLTASPAPTTALDVTVNVTATGSYGVTTGSRTVTIPTTGTATLNVATTGDTVDETDGSVTVTINTGSGYNIDSSASAGTVTISDDDASVSGVSAKLIADVRGYAAETDNGEAHTNRWKRVLLAFGESVPGFTGTPMTVAEAQGFANQFWSIRWDPVVIALQALAAATTPAATTPEISITAGSNVTEGSNATFTLTASPVPSANLDVTVTVSASGSYGVITGNQTITIPTSGTATLNVATTGDTVDETDGSVTATLIDGAAYDLDSTASAATVNISDDDVPEVSIAAGSNITEGANASFTLTVDPTPHSSITVNVTVSATGAYGVTTGSQTVTIPTSGTATLTIATTGDAVDETDGTVTVTVNTGTGYSIDSSAAAATVNVADDDAAVVYVVPAQLITDVQGYATETDNGVAHVNRWKRVLLAFGENVPGFTGTPMTLIEAQGFANQFWSTRWDPVVTALQALAAVTTPAATTPEISITAGNAVTEGSNATFTLTASPAPSANLNVTVAVTATGSYGVTTGSQTVTIPTSGTATLTVATTGDSTDEADGSVTATLNTGNGYTLDSTASAATVAVTDDDVPEVSIAAGSAVTEGSNASFTLIADPTPHTAITINVSVSASGAYGATTGNRTVTIPTSGSATLTIATTDDNLDETDGSVTVTVNTGNSYNVDSSASAATVAISDDDDPPVLPAVTPVVGITAGNNVTEGSSASFTLTANPVPVSPLVVTVRVTASGSYGVTVGTRTVTIGTTGTATLTVATTSDTVDEANGSVTATLVDGAAYDLDSSASTATVNIADDDIPEVSIAAGSDVTEGTSASFTLAADPAPHSSITVNVSVSASGSYGVNTGSRTVTIGTSGTATFTVATTGDTTDEANGSVTVTVNTGSNYTLDSSASAATINITDDDDPPPPAPPVDVVTISVEESIYVEGRSPFYLIRFKLSKPASERVTVKYTPGVLGSGSGYATAGEDFVVRTSSISFRPGVTSNIGLIYALNDRVKEPDETFTIVLSDPEGVHISDKQSVLTIKDND